MYRRARRRRRRRGRTDSYRWGPVLAANCRRSRQNSPGVPRVSRTNQYIDETDRRIDHARTPRTRKDRADQEGVQRTENRTRDCKRSRLPAGGKLNDVMRPLADIGAVARRARRRNEKGDEGREGEGEGRGRQIDREIGSKAYRSLLALLSLDMHVHIK
jgi:hypothetical protein